MSGGKSSSGSKDYYGHIAGIVCCGQLDFIWGVLINNDLVWPKARNWQSKIHQKNRNIIYLDGNVYKTPSQTDVDPPTAPWQLEAIPWAAGTTHTNEKKLYNGNVWQAIADTAIAPPADAPDPVTGGSSLAQLGIQQPESIDGWIYVCTPGIFSGATHFWQADSIVSHNGRLWITDADTNAEPGTGAPWSLWKQDLTGGANPFKFTIEDFGDAYLYLGTATQTLDVVNEQILSALGHPPYRHRAVLMLKNFLFGSSITNPPNVTILGGRKPAQTLIINNTAVAGVDATAMDEDWQVNPWCVLAELLTHPVYGLGLPLSWFDAASWQAEADRCAAAPELHYISPLYDSLKKIRELTADLLGYPDAFVFWSTIATLTAGHWPHHEAAPAFTNENTIDRNDLEQEIESDSEGWGGTANSIEVSFSDIQAGFTTRPAIAPNLFNRAVTRRLTIQRIERPHIVRFNQALAWATEFAKIAGDQTFSGQLTIRAEKAAGIEPGDLFLLTDDVLGFSIAMRCTKKVISAAGVGTVKLSCEVERGVAPQPYAPTPDTSAGINGPPPSTVLNYAAVQLPGALFGESNTIAVLAAREDDSTSSLQVWFRQNDTAAFQQLGTNHGFAVAATLRTPANDEINVGPGDNVTFVNVGQVTQGDTYDLGETDFWKIQVFYSVNMSGFPHFTGVEGEDYTVDPTTGLLTILTGGAIPTNYYVNVKLWQTLVVSNNPNTPQPDMDGINGVPTEDEIEDGKILLFAFRVDNPALFEIMSVRSVQTGTDITTGLPVLFVKVLRAQFGSLLGGDGSYVWGTDANDVIMIINKSAIQPLTHQNFPFYHENESTIHLRLAPASAWEQAEITDLYDPANNPNGLATAFDYTFNNIYAPIVTWGTLQYDGADVSDFTTNFATNKQFSFNFQLTDRNGDLRHAALIAILGQQEVTLWSTNTAPSAIYDKTVVFLLAKGNWKIEMRMLDGAGNQSTTRLIVGGDEVTLYVDNGTAAAPILFNAGVPHNGYVTQLLFGLLPGVAANFQVYYQVQARNVDMDPGDWITCAVVGGAIGGLYKWGDDGTYVTLPPIKKGSNGQTLYAYTTQTTKTDSAVVKWNL